MEEMVENHAACRAVFERWMAWEPDDRAWHAYAAFEERRGDARRARAVLERFVACHPRLPSYLKYARWEERQQQPTLARDAYERALRELGQWEFEAGEEAARYRAFARFEERQREHGRARAILVHACATLDRDAHADVHADLLAFEKKRGAVDAVERQVAEQRRSDYEARVRDHPRDYDAWFDPPPPRGGARARDRRRGAVPRRVRARVRPGAAGGGAVLAARYVYLWLGRAAFEEVDVGDVAAARAALRAALDAVPHAAFTFAKLWLAAADLEVRAKDLGAARRLLGEALGRCRRHAKAKLYRGYASLERRLGEVDRCRRVYGAWVEAAPARAAAWTALADLERAVGETSARARGPRARGGAARPRPARGGVEELRRPRDAPRGAPRGGRRRRRRRRGGERRRGALRAAPRAHAPRQGLAGVRGVRGRGAGRGGAAARERARASTSERTTRCATPPTTTASRSSTRGRAFEAAAARAGDAPAHLDAVEAKLPRKVKRKRPRADDPGVRPVRCAFVFPDDARKPVNLKILEMAKQWKRAEKARPAATRPRRAAWAT